MKGKLFIGQILDTMPILDLFDSNLHVSEEIQKTRLELCEKCPYLRKRVGAQVCFLCGCFLRLKTKLKTEECPILKWKKEK